MIWLNDEEQNFGTQLHFCGLKVADYPLQATGEVKKAVLLIILSDIADFYTKCGIEEISKRAEELQDKLEAFETSQDSESESSNSIV